MSDQTTMAPAGLFVSSLERNPVPLAGVTIDAEIHSFYAKVVVAQRYVNREAAPIEAVYVFPLDEGAAVCGFEAIVDGTLVVGEVRDRDKAFEMYDDAIAAGHGAFLLDEERPDVFQASIGNLPAGKEVSVRLTYVTELSVDDGRLRFVIPTTVSPRYAPADDHKGTGRPDSETLNPPLAFSVPYGLQLSLRVTIPGGISGIESPSHPISVQMRECEATISLGQTETALDRDFVVSIEAAALAAPQAVVERDDSGAEAIGLAFAPSFASAQVPSEIIFLVDRSGSMNGTSIEEVRNALQLCLRSMVPGCSFNIVGFGSTHEALFAESRLYDQSSLEAASAHVGLLAANLGGTEILPALRSVLEARPTASLPRQVVILTDGEVTNTDAVIALAAEHAASARIFTFGIGAGASHHLVRGLARAGGGTAEFIYPGERIEPKVLRQFARLLSPALTDVRVEWTGGRVTQAPSRVPPVFAGGRLLVYGFVSDERPAAARLTANGPDGHRSFDVAIPASTEDSGRTVSTLAARTRIRELEESPESLRARGSRQRDRKGSGVRNEIIALSLRYGLMSRETSFVAIERRETPVEGEVQLRKVPIALTSGWGGVRDADASRIVMMPTARLTAVAPTFVPRGTGPRGVRAEAPPASADLRIEALSAHPDPGDAIAYSRVAPAAAPTRTSRRTTGQNRMHALIVLQAADGSWDLTREFAAIIGRDLDELRAFVQGAQGARESLARLWATALAIAFLERYSGELEQEWGLLAAKARRCIDRADVPPTRQSSWIDAARRFLSDG